MISALLLLGAMAFGVSGLVLAIATYKVVKEGDWEAARIGLALSAICLTFAGGLTTVFFLIGSSAIFGQSTEPPAPVEPAATLSARTGDAAAPP